MSSTPWMDVVLQALPDWLTTRRWFAGKDRPIDAVQALETTVLVDGDPALVHLVVEVRQGERRDVYQLLVGARRAEAPDVPAAAVIEVDDGVTMYEASGDADLSSELLGLLAREASIGDVSFQLEPDVVLDAGLRGRPITSEQSNTSLVFGSQYILKLFRRLSPGLNKDLVLHRALRDAGCQHIAQPLGSIAGRFDGQETTLGMVQQFFPDAADGWAMATTSVRDLMADPGTAPEEHGGDFSGEARRLGQAVAHVHADLARALGTADVGPDELAGKVRTMTARLDAVAADVPQLAPHVPGIRAALERVRELPTPLRSQYVHGDLHLGQVLRTVGGWTVIDFEGEPAAPLEERAALRSPLRDVAGMLRSFDYAAHQLLVGQPDDVQALTYGALNWAQVNRDAFCDGYASVSDLGDPREQAVLLTALELDKAVYEVGYEHANRPDWLEVPLSSIARIVEGVA